MQLIIHNNGKPIVGVASAGRNTMCRCLSGKKYKHCCLSKDEAHEINVARNQDAERAIKMKVIEEEVKRANAKSN